MEVQTAVFPLGELDRRVAPLRRVLAWSLQMGPEGAGRVRFLEANGGRLVARAAELDLPHAIRDRLAVVAGRLSGFDELESTARWERILELNQHLWRLDALLGLPLGSPPAPARATPSRKKKGRKKGSSKGKAIEASHKRRGGKKPAADKSRADRPVPAGARPEPSDEPALRPHRLLDAATTGRSLSECGLDDPVVDGLAQTGLSTAADLLLLPPTTHEVIRPIHGAGRQIPAGRVAVGGRIVARAVRLHPDGSRSADLLLRGAGPLRVQWDGEIPPWMEASVGVDSRVVFLGHHQPAHLDTPAVLRGPELVVDDGQHGVHLAGYEVAGLDPDDARRLVSRFLPEVDRVRDPVPEAMLKRLGLPALSRAIRDAHQLGDARPEARRRLAFDEALLVQLGQAWARFHGPKERGIGHPLTHGLASSMSQRSDAQLTDEQQLAFEMIKRDIRSRTPMLRVLTDEGGAGRGRVAMMAAAMVADSKSQILFLSPDEASLELRLVFSEPVLRELGLVARALPTEPSRAQRDAVRRGEVHVVFGTRELLEQGIEFRRLGLVVVEEREQLGSTSQVLAKWRPPKPDLLVLPGESTPASVLLTAYRGHDVTVLPAPFGRCVTNVVVPGERREEAYRRAAAAVREGAQAFVVFPLVRGIDAFDARDATRVVATLEAEVFEGLRVSLFHGAMARDDRYRIYDDFCHRRSDVLVATTLFEEGPTVPGASVAVVEQADRVDRVRLQRIRGLVAGAERDGECHYVVGEVPDEEGRTWVELIVEGRIGSALTQAAVERSGLEQFVADGLTAAPRFAWLDPARDLDLVLEARREAHALLASQPGNRRGELGELLRMVRERWGGLMDEPCPVPAPSGGSRRRRRRRRKS